MKRRDIFELFAVRFGAVWGFALLLIVVLALILGCGSKNAEPLAPHVLNPEPDVVEQATMTAPPILSMNPEFAQTMNLDLIPIPVELEIRGRGSLDIWYYEFKVTYHFSPTWRQDISYYAPKYPKPLLSTGNRLGLPKPSVMIWIMPPKNSYQFDVRVRVVGKSYKSEWSDSVSMISDGGD